MQKFKDVFDNLGYYYEDHLNILINLMKSEDLLLKQMHSTRRKQIRRALRRGVTVKEFESIGNINKIYSILSEVYARAKLPLADKSLFNSAFKILNSKKMIKCFGAFNNKELIGVRCVLAYKNTLYDWYAGSLKKYLDKYPNDLLPWEVFKWGKENGYTIFDFGGAGKSNKPYGVRNYKKKFGGQMVNYGRYEKVLKPLSMQIGKLGFKIYRKIK